MSAYTELRDQAQSLLQAAARFSSYPERVATRFAILDAGADEAVILTPAGFGEETEAGQMNYREWGILINLFVRVAGSEDDAIAQFEDLRGAVVDLFAIYPTLNHYSGVSQQSLASDGDPEFIYDKAGNGPFFLMQILRLTVTHRATLAGGEF